MEYTWRECVTVAYGDVFFAYHVDKAHMTRCLLLSASHHQLVLESSAICHTSQAEWRFVRRTFHLRVYNECLKIRISTIEIFGVFCIKSPRERNLYNVFRWNEKGSLPQFLGLFATRAITMVSIMFQMKEYNISKEKSITVCLSFFFLKACCT